MNNDRTNTGLCAERLKRFTRTMQGYVDRGEVAGMVTLIHRRGQISHCDTLGWRDREAHEPMQRDTIFRIASMTKPIAVVAALTLIEEGKLRLDDRIDRWLPELTDMSVIRCLDGSLDDVYPSSRPILLSDLLTHRAGFTLPNLSHGSLDVALSTFNDTFLPALPPDDWIRQLGRLPLAHDPGSRWSYGLSMDVLGVLIARVTDHPFSDFLRERIFEPLEMSDTGFFVPESERSRLAVLYERSSNHKGLVREDYNNSKRWEAIPDFTSGGGGLVSTADDYLKFAQMLHQGGRLAGSRVLSAKTIELMTTNHLTPEQRTHKFLGVDYWAGQGYGFGVEVVDSITRQNRLTSVGEYHMGGAYGTYCQIDPSEDLIIIIMLQLLAAHDFLDVNQFASTLVYQSLNDV